MSNKVHDKLNAIDLDLRRALPRPGPSSEGVQLAIEKICGFELFNTRPYHNHENWSDGWRIRGYGITVEQEDLDDAVREFIAKYAQHKATTTAVARDSGRSER